MGILVAPWASRRSRRAVAVRTAAVLLGLLPLVLVELVLRACGLGRPDGRDPFVEFSGVRPLFERTASGDQFEIAPARYTHFFPDSFPAQKPADEYRIFCIGDSTVQGNPWTTETSFPAWLEISLQAAQPSRRWNVVNCGGISYASYRMVPMLEEVLRYQPDLVILHCSHNEFLEDRSYPGIVRLPRSVWQLQQRVSELRLYQVLRVAWQSVVDDPAPARPLRAGGAPVAGSFEPRPVLREEVEALLDYRGGLERYHHDAAWRRGVTVHYEFNMRRMVSLARQAHVPLILLNPACNLRDSPPFKAEHRPGLAAEQRERCARLWTEARFYYSTQPWRAARLLREALAIDDQHAGLHYDLAKCLDVLGKFSDAQSEYVQAKEWDVCPLRILESMREIVHEVGRDMRTPVVDLRAGFEGLSRDGIPGDGWFVDHVHPSIPGYQRVADAVADQLVRQGIVRPQAGWRALREQRFAAHLDALPASYFVGAQRRLDSLMLWAHGRATRVPSNN
jgi:lysophospholipase L1-like esterase